MTGTIIENRVLRAIVCCGLFATVWAGRLQAGERAPRVELPGVDGGQVVYAPPREDPGATEKDRTAAVILFVRPTQRQSVTALQDLRTWRDRNAELAPRVRLIAIASGELADEDVAAFRDHLPASASIAGALDPEKQSFKSFGVVALPTTFVLDSTGVIVEVLPGRSASFPKRLDAGLRKALGLADVQESPATPETPEATKANRLRNMAADLIERGELDVAAEQLAKAVELQPGDLELHLLLGDLRLRLEDGSSAKATFERALELSPESRAAKSGRAKSLALGDDLEAAESALREVLTRPPQEAAVFYYLGRVLERGERHADAAKSYRRAYEQLLAGH